MRDRGLPHAARRRHAGRGHRGQAAGRADLARSSSDLVDRRRCWSPSATSSARSRCSSASKRRWSKGAGAAGLAAMLADPERFRGKKVATVAVRRQYRHASARQRAGPRPGPQRPHRAAARRRPGPARRARRDHRQVLRSRRQHHRDQPQPHLHPAAGQGHGDRGRMRGARRRRRSTTSSRGSRRPASTSSAPRSTELG